MPGCGHRGGRTHLPGLPNPGSSPGCFWHSCGKSCRTGVTQWIAVCSGLLQTAVVQGQCRRMLHGIFQRQETGQFQLSKACGGFIQANGTIKQLNRTFYNTNKHLSAKDSLQTEEKVGPFTRIIEAMGFTGPLKYSRWKIKVAALRMYTCCVEKTDYEEFFNRCQMPDTLNSWFLVAQLHVWLKQSFLY
nr:ubiquinol-cytochrome-c reductase complex assembly factor 1 isoform X2 [Anser cygnoides]